MTEHRVVIIDSGIDARHPTLRERARVTAGPSFAASGAVDPVGGGTDRLGHGTAVAATIARFGAAAEFVSLRVFDELPTCDFAAVLHALAYAVELAPRCINLSLGTTSLRYQPQLTQLLAAAKARGTHVVAPVSYGGLPCAPGNLAGCEAVVADANLLPLLPELRWHQGRMLWFASPLPPPDADGVRRLRARGDSLAVAAVTGCLLRSLPV